MLAPAAVLGGVVQLQPIGQPPGLGRWERRIQRRRGVGVEVVLDQPDLLGVGVVDLDQVLAGSAPQSIRVRRSLTMTWRQPASGSQTRNRLHTPPRWYS
jgi:hypothetical protein